MANKSYVFSILMPTYNDQEYIAASIESVLLQSYGNWELIIVDDASTDQTRDVVSRFSDERIKYFRQEKNGDQLNALLRAAREARGDFYMLLHSDDRLRTNSTLESLRNTFGENPQYDGFFADLITINDAGEEVGRLVAEDCDGDNLVRAIIMGYGGNLRFDHFVLKKEAFETNAKKNYLINNTIYYVTLDAKGVFLNLSRAEPWYCYRVYGGNYINSDVGRFVATNGPIRTIKRFFDAGMFFDAWFFRSYFLFRVFRKIGVWKVLPVRKVGVSRRSLRAYMNCWYKDLKRQKYPQILLDQLNAIMRSLKNRENGMKNKPLIIINSVEVVYDGKDARQFFKDFSSACLPTVYRDLLYGDYDHIVTTQDHISDVERMVRFLALDSEIVVSEKVEQVQ